MGSTSFPGVPVSLGLCVLVLVFALFFALVTFALVAFSLTLAVSGSCSILRILFLAEAFPSFTVTVDCVKVMLGTKLVIWVGIQTVGVLDLFETYKEATTISGI